VVQTLQIEPISSDMLDELGFSWHTDSDGSRYISDHIVEVTQNEADAYYEAANTLYDMYVQAAE